MVIPLVLGAAMAGGMAIKGTYDISKSLETRRYLDQYARKRRVKIRYPYRSGYYDYARTVGSTLQSVGAFGLARYASGAYSAGRASGWNHGYDVGFRTGYWNRPRRSRYR